jgi:hypothetical protein
MAGLVPAIHVFTPRIPRSNVTKRHHFRRTHTQCYKAAARTPQGPRRGFSSLLRGLP